MSPNPLSRRSNQNAFEELTDDPIIFFGGIALALMILPGVIPRRQRRRGDLDARAPHRCAGRRGVADHPVGQCWPGRPPDPGRTSDGLGPGCPPRVAPGGCQAPVMSSPAPSSGPAAEVPAEVADALVAARWPGGGRVIDGDVLHSTVVPELTCVLTTMGVPPTPAYHLGAHAARFGS